MGCRGSAGWLRRVEPDVLHEGHVLATMTKPDGKTVTARLPWDRIKTSGAMLLPGKRPVILLFHLSDGDNRVPQNAVTGRGAFNEVTQVFSLADIFRADFRHELIHALRGTGALSGERWRRLVDHANALGMLELDAGLPVTQRMIGRALGSSPERTLRQACTGIYARYSDPQELIDQESVTSLVEQAWLGNLTDADLAPVR